MSPLEKQRVESVPAPRERLADILRLVAQEPPAPSAKEAWAVLDRAFTKVEDKMPGEHMYVHSFESFQPMTISGKEVYVDFYDRHTLLLGTNGAIEVRLANPQIIGHGGTGPKHEFSHLKVIMEKQGEDGYFLWE